MANELQRYIIKWIKSGKDLERLGENISKNPNITWKFVCDYPQIRWDFYQLTDNPNITPEIVFMNPNYNWNYKGIIRNWKLSPTEILKYIDIIDVQHYYDLYITYSDIEFELFVKTHFKITVEFGYIFKFTDKDVLPHINNYELVHSICRLKSKIQNIYEIFVALCPQYKDLDWDYGNILLYLPFRDNTPHNNDIYFNYPLSILSITIDKPWSWNLMSFNKNLTFEFIREHINLDWSIYNLLAVSDQYNITTDQIVSLLPNKKWNVSYNHISKYNIPLWFIEANIEKNWNLDSLIKYNKNITWEFIQKHNNLPWNYFYIQSAPFMTLDLLQEIEEKIGETKYCSDCSECSQCGDDDCNCEYCEQDWCSKTPDLPLLTFSKNNYKKICFEHFNNSQIIISNLKPIIFQYI